MNIRDATALLTWKREDVIAAIKRGVELPKSKERIKLLANPVGTDYDIPEDCLDNFIAAFEREEPGRHPPVSVRRALLCEANHRCAICRDSAPLQFHHILEFSRLSHHDAHHMLAVCGTCHDKISLGHIDNKGQYIYKQKLLTPQEFPEQSDAGGLFPDDFPVRFSWYDLKDIIVALHHELSISNPAESSKYDFAGINLERKNELNRMGADYFAMMRDHHEPYFGRIEEFMKSPVNVEVANLYYEVVDELRSKVAADQDNFKGFEYVLIQICDAAKSSPEFRNKRRTLNILLSFMYFHCDIGRKK